jgi:cytidylate kinase
MPDEWSKFERRVIFMYFITISELLGTNGEKIARKVAEELKYTFYGTKELFEAAAAMGFLSDAKKSDENVPALLERLFSDKPKIYLDRLQSVIYDVAKKGNAVFFGRGGKFLLHSFDCAFHILVTGSMEKRIQRVMEEKQAGREVAEKIISHSDHDKRAFVRFAYDEDMLNPRLYDLLLNTDKLSIDSAAKMIVDAANSEEIKSCGIDSVQLLGKLSLTRKVESLLLEAGATSPHIFFTVEETNAVRLFGFADSSAEKERVENLVRKIKEIKTIKNELVVFTESMRGE